MTITVWPVDAVAGAPEYSGKLARQAMSASLSGATSARPLGTQSGVRYGTPTDTVSVSGSTVTIKPHAGVLDLQAAAGAGVYWYAIDANETETLNAAHSTHPRIDIITVKLDDPAESDGSSVPAVTVVYKAGTAAASPATPTPDTSRELVIATIAVPASGGGDGVASWVAPYAVAAGGIVPVRTEAERDALATAVGPTTHAPLYVHRIDAAAGQNLESTVDGSTWNAHLANDSGWSSSDPGLVMGTGWSLVTVYWRIIGRTAHISIRAEATSTHTLTATSGAITNPTVCTLPAPLATASTAFAQGLSGGNSRIAGVSIIGSAVTISSIAGTANIVSTDRVTIAGSYALDVP